MNVKHGKNECCELGVHTRFLDPRAVLVRLSGDLDVFTTPKLNLILAQIAEKGVRTFIISMEKLEFIDGSGLRILENARKSACGRGGSLALVFTNPHFQKIFRITGLARIFPIYETCDQGIEACLHAIRAGAVRLQGQAPGGL